MFFPKRFMLKPVSGGSENAKTTAWVNAVVAAGGSVSAGRRTTVNTLFNSLDSNSLTTTLNRLWLLAAENTQSASIDLINLQTYTLVNTPTFTTDQGYAGNGTSSYLNLGTIDAGTQNATTFGMALRTNQANANVNSMGSSNTTTESSNIYVSYVDGNNYFDNNDNNSDGGRTSPATRNGIYINTRTTSSLVTLYKGGSSFATQTLTSTAVCNRNYCLGACLDSGGTAVAFTANQFSAVFLGNTGYTGTQASNFTTNLQTYLTAVGA